MNSNLCGTAAVANQAVRGGLLQKIGVQPVRNVEQARIAFLARRFGLSPSRAVVVAALAFGEAAR